MARIDKDALLRHAMRRASGRDAYVASALAAYQTAHQMDDAMLAETLGCTVASLPRLALCLKPNLDSPNARADVRRIADFAGVEVFPLLAMLREAESAAAMRGVATAGGAMLAAARDRDIPADGDDSAADGRDQPPPEDRGP